MNKDKLQRKILAQIRRADTDFNLINDNDKIIIGVSGGKDSIVICYFLKLYQKFSNKKFEFKPVMLDLGFELGDNFNKLVSWFEDLEMPLYISNQQQVYKILSLHKNKNGQLPCSICSRMKKAAINSVATELGYNKVIFAHHADDCIETLFLNMVFGGKVNTFEAKMHLERANITFIRPLIYTREEDVIKAAETFNLPVVKSKCPNDKVTQRAKFKDLINEIYKKYPEAYDNFLNMLTNQEQLKLLFNGEFGYSDGKGIFIKKVVTKDDYIDSFHVRKEVFIKEQKVSLDEELDKYDKVSTYYNLYKDNKVVGTLRMIKVDDKTYRMGRFCILKKFRKLGLGSLFYKYLVHIYSSKIVPLKIVISAQYDKIEFYKKLGFIQTSDKIYLDANIKHVDMEANYLYPLNLKEVK